MLLKFSIKDKSHSWSYVAKFVHVHQNVTWFCIVCQQMERKAHPHTVKFVDAVLILHMLFNLCWAGVHLECFHCKTTAHFNIIQWYMHKTVHVQLATEQHKTKKASHMLKYITPAPTQMVSAQVVIAFKIHSFTTYCTNFAIAAFSAKSARMYTTWTGESL